jgi:hypothetical protein
MSFPITTKLAALLNVLTQADIDALPPARRQHLGQLLLHWGAKCTPPNGAHKPANVLPATTPRPHD